MKSKILNKDLKSPNNRILVKININESLENQMIGPEFRVQTTSLPSYRKKLTEDQTKTTPINSHGLIKGITVEQKQSLKPSLVSDIPPLITTKKEIQYSLRDSEKIFLQQDQQLRTMPIQDSLTQHIDQSLSPTSNVRIHTTRANSLSIDLKKPQTTDNPKKSNGKAKKPFDRILECIKYQEKPLDIVRSAVNVGYQTSIRLNLKPTDQISNSLEISSVMSPKSYGSYLYSIANESNILVPKIQSSISGDQSVITNTDDLLHQFRVINKIVRQNKSSDLKYRQTHLPRFGYQYNSNTLPSSKTSRAPKLTQKIARIEMCTKLVNQAAAIERNQNMVQSQFVLFQNQNEVKSPVYAKRANKLYGVRNQISLDKFEESDLQTENETDRDEQRAFSQRITDYATLDYVTNLTLQSQQSDISHPRINGNNANSPSPNSVYMKRILQDIQNGVTDSTPLKSRMQGIYEQASPLTIKNSGQASNKSPDQFNLIKSMLYLAPIHRKPQVFMFDGVRKRKVILKDAQNIGNRLEF